MKVKSKDIWDFVKDLLHEHDCVIVPGFGGFVCNAEPSRIDQVSHLITPPAKRIVFNQNLKTNDGLLAARISQQLKLGYPEAIQLIDETVNKTKYLLTDKKSLAIEFFGSFRLNADANYVFLPDKQNNFLYSSFGLMPLQAEPVASRAIRAGKSRIFKDRKEIKAVKGARRKTTLRVVAAAFTLLLAVNLFIFIKDPELRLGGTTMNISSWFDSLFHSTSQPQVTEVNPPAIVVPGPEVIAPLPEPIQNDPTVLQNDTVSSQSVVTETEAPREFDLMAFAEHIASARAKSYVPVPGEVPTPVIEEPVNETAVARVPDPVKSIVPKITGDSSFYIIGGVFCKERNARRFFHELEEKGYTPEMLVNSSLNCNRVSYARYTSRKQAEQELRNIHASVNKDAWLLVER